MASPHTVAVFENMCNGSLICSHPTTTVGELPSAPAGVLTAAALGWVPAPKQGFPDRSCQYLATQRATSLDSGERGPAESQAREQAVATMVLYLDGKPTLTRASNQGWGCTRSASRGFGRFLRGGRRNGECARQEPIEQSGAFGRGPRRDWPVDGWKRPSKQPFDGLTGLDGPRRGFDGESGRRDDCPLSPACPPTPPGHIQAPVCKQIVLVGARSWAPTVDGCGQCKASGRAGPPRQMRFWIRLGRRVKSVSVGG